MTAPLKGGAIEGGKIVGKKAIEKLVVREAGKLATNVGVRAVTQVVTDKASGSSGGHYSQSSGGYYSQSGRKRSGTASSQKSSEFSNDKPSFGFTSSQYFFNNIRNSLNTVSMCLETSGAGAGGGGDPPKYPKLPKEHEMDENDYDYSKVLANCFDDD